MNLREKSVAVMTAFCKGEDETNVPNFVEVRSKCNFLNFLKNIMPSDLKKLRKKEIYKDLLGQILPI